MIVKLDNVVNRITGNEDRFTTNLEYFIGGEHYDSENPIITNRGIIRSEKGNLLGFKFHFPFKKGDVLFMARNPHLKKAGMVTFDGICSDASYILRTKDEKVLLQDFLPFIIQNEKMWQFFEANKSGSVNYLMNWKELKNYEFNLPPLEEQKKLAKTLWQIVDTMESYKKLLAKTDEIVISKFDEILLNETRTIQIKDLVDLQINKIKKDTKINEINYIDISSIDKDTKRIIGTTKYSIKEAPSRALQIVHKNDLLISTVRPNLKTIAINYSEELNTIASTGFCVLRAKKCPVNYLFGIVNSNVFTNQMISEATGISYPAVNDKNILDFKIPDIDKQLQNDLAIFVQKSEESKSAIQASLDSLKQVYKKIITEKLG